jgi:hypothetical protein
MVRYEYDVGVRHITKMLNDNELLIFLKKLTILNL